VIVAHQNLIYKWLTYAKSTGELISSGFSDRSVPSLVSAKRSANRSVQTKKRLYFLTDLWSQSGFRTQRNAERKTDAKSEMTHCSWVVACCVWGSETDWLHWTAAVQSVTTEQREHTVWWRHPANRVYAAAFQWTRWAIRVPTNILAPAAIRLAML